MKSEASEINRLTEEMTDAYGIIDEDAEYMYSGR